MRKRRGSLTVEAALIVPIFIYAIVAFVYLIQVILIQESLMQAMEKTAQKASTYLMICEQKEEPEEKMQRIGARLLQNVWIKTELAKELHTRQIKENWILGGLSGIHTARSFYEKGNAYIHLVADYRISLPLHGIGIQTIPIEQRICLRAFVGAKGGGQKQGDQELDPIVYITPNGSVYHEKRECSYLKLKIRAVQMQAVSSLRNEEGAKYKPCKKCVKRQKINPDATVYIANDGRHYHKDLSCSGLRRSIIAIPKSKVGDRRPCKRCSEGGEK